MLMTFLSHADGIPRFTQVLDDRDEELRAHCEAPDVALAPTSPSGGVGRGHRRRTREAAAQPPPERPMVNSHSQYTGHNAVERTKLSAPVQAELDRLANAHQQMLNELGLHEL